MSVVGGLLVVLIFIACVYVLSLVARSREVLSLARHSALVLRDPQLTDEEKESALQRASIRMLGLALLLFGGFAAALIVPLGVIWLLDRAGVLELPAVMGVLLRWDFLVIVSVVGIAAHFLIGKFRR